MLNPLCEAEQAECDENHRSGDCWDEYDGRGIYVCRVCNTCVDQKLSAYRPEVLNTFYSQVNMDEDIEPDEW